LKLHPEIFLPEKKELTFFCKDIHSSSDNFHGYPKHYKIRTLERYNSFYLDAREGQILGEVTPHYSDSKVAARQIYDYNPEAKIIFLLREPVSFLFSLFKDFSACLNEEEDDFLVALNKERERRNGKGIPETVSYPEALFYSEWIKYKEQIKRYVDLFGNKKVKVFFLKDIKENKGGVYKEILKFVGVKDISYFPQEEVFSNPASELRFRKLYVFMKNSKLLKKLINKFPSRLYSRISGWVNVFFEELFFARKSNKSLSSKTEKFIKNELKKEVEDLEEYLREEGFIDFNLVEFWGYED